MRANAAGKASLSAWAPKLPPNTNTRKGPLRPAKRAAGGACWANDARNGLPIHSPRAIAPGNAQNTRAATRLSQRLAMPAMEFCSCSTKGRPHSTPIMPPGKLM